MVLLNRVGPAVAATAAGLAFLVVFSSPQAVYVVVVALLCLLFTVATQLPAPSWSEKLQRWLALSLPVLAGGWAWLFMQQSSWRLALPLLVTLVVFITGESLFRAAYGPATSLVRWLTIQNVVTAWLFFDGLTAAWLLQVWPSYALPLVSGLVVVLLLAQGHWAVGIRFGPWWSLSTAGVAFAQLSWVVLLLPTVYPVQGAVLTLLYGAGLWLYLKKGSGIVRKAEALSLTLAVVLAVATILAAWTI